MASEDITIVVSVINGVLNPNNEIRNSFVAKLEELRKNTPALFFCLIKILENDWATENQNEVKKTKTVAAVLARKLIAIKEDELVSQFWLEMNKELKEQIKSSLIGIFLKEKDSSILMKVCDIIVQVAVNSFENEETWEDLLQILLKILNMNLEINQNTNFLQLESTLLVLAGIFSFVFDEMMKNISVILEAFKVFLSQPDLTLRTRTARTIAEVITYCEKKELKYFQDFIFPILETTLKCLEASVSGSDTLKAENNLKYSLKAITDISSSHPVLIKKHFNDLFTLMCKIVETKEFTDENLREMGFEVIVNLVERRNSLFTKDEAKLKYFLELLYKYALEMEKEVTDEWAIPTTHSYFEEEFIYEEKVSSAFSFIDRLIEHLDCKFMLPYLSEIILQLLQNDKDWRFKYIALLSISQVMNYVDDMVTIENIFPIVFSHTSDPSPKIRYAAVNCINEMSESFEPHFQANYHDKAVPALLDRISNETVLRVQLESLEALNTFISHQTDSQCIVYIQQLLETLFALFLKDIPVNLRCEILEAIAEIVATTEKHFEPYTEKSLNILLEYFNTIYTQKIHKSLYGNLIECITLIGNHNWGVYKNILPNIVKIVVELTENIPLSKDPIREYLQEALERIIPLLKEHFKELLPTVVNSVLKLVQSVPEMSVSSKPEETFKIEDLLGKETNEPEIKIQSTSVKTSQTEDMAESIELLNTTIEALQDLFIPYIETTQSIILPLLNYYINEDVRMHASNTLPLILNIVAKYSTKENVSLFGKNYISELIQIIEKEFDNETLSLQLENLGEVIVTSGMILSKEELNTLFNRILGIFDDVEKRRLKLVSKHGEVKISSAKKTDKIEDDEPESDEELLEDIEKDIEEIEQIQSDIADVIGFLFKTHKELSGDIVNKLLTEMLPKYFRDNASHFEIKMGIFIADDMIEYLGQDYLENIWNDLERVVVKFCDNNDCSIRQAACYGVGVFAQHTQKDFHLYIDDCLYALNKALAFVPDDTNENDWGLARDNAVASLGRIIKYQSSVTSNSLHLIINQWLKFLPITYDLSECPEQHEFLCDIFINKPELIFGENYSNLNHILRIFGKIYKTKYSVKDVNDKIDQIFSGIKNDPNLMSEATKVVSVTEEGKLKNKLSNLLSK